jgi:uncharacterized protein YigA (DUF484 family)
MITHEELARDLELHRKVFHDGMKREDDYYAMQRFGEERWPLYVAEVQRQAARIKELEAEKTKLLKGPNYNQGWELDAEIERLTARVAELEATVARLRSLLGKLVQKGGDAIRLMQVQDRLAAWDAAVKEATDAK